MMCYRQNYRISGKSYFGLLRLLDELDSGDFSKVEGRLYVYLRERSQTLKREKYRGILSRDSENILLSPQILP